MAIKKAEIQEVSSMAILPEDIIISHLLPKLHPKTLMQFKCTNKFYKTQISSQKFIDEHIHQSLSSSSNGLLIFFTAHVNGIQRLYSLDLGSPNLPAVYLPLPEPFHGEYNHFDIVGSSNGLLCLRSAIGNKHFSHFNSHFLHLNPCTRMFGSSSLTAAEVKR
ncbi:F-box protein At5g10340-like [Beta vulgaris subsp. vulgaris]|uniref:F-box protein At5g10340-like n=1 Tax=Beta vulgaris subsp. vulgaris TaxID=3555 RepID=UPI002547075A|nr:F-box protein At5g10340-like [Beta vulgaris subsp. vulgaris]